MALPTTVIYFTCYDQLSEAVKSRLGKDDEHIPVLAGALSRFGSVTVVSPLELIRTRMQYRKLSYKQLYTCVSSKVATDGWFSLWRGWSSTVLRDVPFSGGVYFPCKFVLCQKICLCITIAAVITLPFDVVKTHRQTELWESETLKSIIPRLFKVAPACAIMISTYEYGKSFFSHLNEKMNQRP
uniref:Solute carrier family 25 member 40 n=1 Tax=Buteo japonicus TaxID=224669 RepID=A0A8C0BXQ4_9AVES